jgi:hypothetical protein
VYKFVHLLYTCKHPASKHHTPRRRTNMSTVTFRRRGTIYTVRFRYNPTLVELIKDVVPSYARSWNRATREWIVDTYEARQLASAMRQLGHKVIGLDLPNINGNNKRNGPKTCCVGNSRIEPVHRALTQGSAPRHSQRRHPITAGDSTTHAPSRSAAENGSPGARFESGRLVERSDDTTATEDATQTRVQTRPYKGTFKDS